MASISDLLALETTERIPLGVAAYDGQLSAALKYREAGRRRRSDIGEIPPIEDIERKNACQRDFRLFCEEYYPHVFTLDWSQDHLNVIERIEQAVLFGGLFAMAMPRGSGKTSLCEAACVWSMFYGHRKFICYIGSDLGLAVQALESIKVDIETNDYLFADFPEVCYPISRLERIAIRTRTQTYKGENTRADWGAQKIVLPTIPGSLASGSIVRIAGLTGQIRGMKHKVTNGEAIRPDLIIADDPQTDVSARSVSQCKTRESILSGAILNLAGPDKKISGIMPCTIIQQNDLAHRILDTGLHPEWQGRVTKMVYKWPTNSKLWETYTEIRKNELGSGGSGKRATEFYEQNKELMDAGVEVAWPERKNYDELSAIQHAYNLRMRDEFAFFSEYQNDPLTEEDLDSDGAFSSSDVTSRLNGYNRGEVPTDTDKITCYIDVHRALLYYTVCAWKSDFTGYVIEYGTYPKQTKDYFTVHGTEETMMAMSPQSGFEGALWTSLEKLIDYLYAEDNWSGRKIDLGMIDAGWGETTDQIYSFCRQTPVILVPSHGKYVGATNKRLDEYGGKAKVGLNWRIPKITGREVRHILYDTNFWKTFLLSRVRTVKGDIGSLTFHKNSTHSLLTDHLMAEYRVKVEAKGQTVYEWKVKPSRFDNHWLDCLVGSCVGASITGIALPQMAKAKKAINSQVKRSTQRVSYL